MSKFNIVNQSNITTYESNEVDKIKEWHNAEPWVITQAMNTLFKPVVWLINKVIPQTAIEGAVKGSNWLAVILTDKNDIVRDGRVNNIKQLQTKDIKLSDELANEVHNWAIGIATAEGGATGFFGLPGMAADIPMIITLALRTIHKIGLCYGFEHETTEDHQIILQILTSAGANNVEEKFSALLTLQMINQMIANQTWKAMASKASGNQFSKEAAILTIKNLAKQLGINLTKRKALQAIPLIGAAVGASVNGVFISDIGWAARRVFQQRWLESNNKILVEII